jgi:hypothetical protein
MYSGEKMRAVLFPYVLWLRSGLSEVSSVGHIVLGMKNPPVLRIRIRGPFPF